jgi:tRNA threonylcarbamoyl adenosine modification protein (Sua5/YciO/YrdC/YwlC family)
MLLRIHPKDPQPRAIQQVVDCLRKGGVIIYPTDTVYGIGCDINQRKAVERICQIRRIDPDKAQFSFICSDLSHISEYCASLDTPVFKMMRRALPGPYTFILNATSRVPKIFQSRKRTVGIRVPDHVVPVHIVRELGNPIMTSSVHDDDDMTEYTTDPELIHEKYGHLVDIVIDSGYGGIEASTVVDCSGPEPLIVRQGKGDADLLF